MKVIAYLRVSTSVQARGSGLERQKNGIIKWCHEQNISLDDVLFVTDVCSAFKEDHLKSSSKNPLVGNLGRLIDGLNSGTITSPEYFVFEAWDRITRSTASVQLDLQRALGDAKMVSLYEGESPIDEVRGYALALHKEMIASGFFEKIGIGI